MGAASEGDHGSGARILTALDGTIIAVNPALCGFLGRSEHELVGAAGMHLLHPDDHAAAASDMERLRGGRITQVRAERRFLRPDGRVVWGDTSTEAVRDPDGDARYWQSIIIDITRRKVAEEAQAWLAASS